MAVDADATGKARGRTAPDGGTRTGRPPLTERRKAATRLEIARGAVRLFGERGVAATSAEDIAAAVGMSVRTLWRYFPAKEQCVRPLLTDALDKVIAHLRDWPRDRPLSEALGQEWPFGPPQDAEATRALIRLVDSEPELHAVWLEVHHGAEAVFAGVVADRTGRPATDLGVRVQAMIMNGAMRVGAEEWARGEGQDPHGHGESVRGALRAAFGGLDC